jgi:hypothetical protein
MPAELPDEFGAWAREIVKAFPHMSDESLQKLADIFDEVDARLTEEVARRQTPASAEGPTPDPPSPAPR